MAGGFYPSLRQCDYVITVPHRLGPTQGFFLLTDGFEPGSTNLGGLNGFITLPQSYILILSSSDLMYTTILSELTNSFEANSLVLHSLRRQLSDFPAVQQFEGCLSYSL